MFFPSGREEGSTIRVDKDAPAKIRVGRPYTESITVTNISPKDLQNVVMTERLSPNFKPSPGEGVELREGSAAWNIGSLKPGESRTFQLSGVAEKPGEIRHCLRVDFQPELCTARTAEVAALELSMKGPKETLLCEPIEYEFSVRNPGSATLDGVKVQGALPEGLALEEGKTSDLSLDVGSLAPGQTKTLKARVKPSHRGEVTTKASAAAEDLHSESSWQTVVREPVLDVAARATPSAYMGAPSKAEITATNKGDAPSAETVIQATVPQGYRITEAGQDGQVSGNTVSWKVGSVPPSGSKTLNVTYTGSGVGTAELAVQASGRCAAPVQATAKTEFRGVPGVLLEVVDDPDPVAVGGTVTYTITVTNQGNATLNQVHVTCDLEDSMTYGRAEGATSAKNSGRRVDFEPLGELAPKAKAVWKVQVKSTRAADARFKTSVTSEQVPRPVEETESTHFVPQSE